MILMKKVKGFHYYSVFICMLKAPSMVKMLIGTEDYRERHPTRALEAVKKRPHQRFDPLVGHRHHMHPPRVLQAVGRKMDPLLLPVG